PAEQLPCGFTQVTLQLTTPNSKEILASVLDLPGPETRFLGENRGFRTWSWRRVYPIDISTTSNRSMPLGTGISATSPVFFPSSPWPIGLVDRIRLLS